MKNIAKIIRISKPLWGLTALIAFLIIITALLDQVAPILSKFIVDEIVQQIQTGEGDQQILVNLIAASFIVVLINITLTTVTNRLGDHFAGRLQQFLTETFYAKILALPQSYFDSELSGKIVNQLSRGILTIKGFANTATNFILPTLLQTIITIAVLAYFNPPTAFFVFMLFPIYLTISYFSSKRWGEEEKKKNKLEDAGRGRIQEVISNMKLVKSANTQESEYRFISDNQTGINTIYARQSGMFHRFDFLRNLSLIVIVLIVNIITYGNAYTGALTIGDMVLILQLVVQAQRPLFAMSFILTQLQTAESGSKEFFEILELEATEPYYDTGFDTRRIKSPDIRFDDVSFSYEESDEVLHNVTLNFRSGEKVALVGHSGAGKSTIINLIMGFYKPTRGEIYLKDKAYSASDIRDIRNNISMVFQENELFSSTVRENIRYGSPDASEEELITALKQANAWDFVSKLPKGLDSEIGERGIKLSGGQKQRLQIARAILEDSPVLILDEATSSLDSRSEQQVQEALERLMQDRLVIIIAHRFSTIQNVDRVVVIDKGTVADSGSPRELAARKDSIYAELLSYQIEGNKKLLKNYELY
ncbi:MAG: putative multidrug export ATP-binding/permease protein [candidate division WS6 bacterium OLB20]|uniref:Putative multidrug export ATP-binding/permease protein n=1 Tax=candidate division WS6 bacterium OLB20 TaxID=1617426 RepID=A0A136LXS8_9BACT|nr:MAG: putative multidrug export ATP-binding/permease protein [candidate division WS6 bacterium OLB20]